jgi:D-cysteine desulfhydrase
MKLNSIPRIQIANLPTPLEAAPRLARHIGLSELYFKRDDLTGLAGGGNKARKLEYDFAEIIKGGYDVVLTAGGIQSNHARMTAAAARKFGIDVKLVLGGPDYPALKGNLLINNLFDAEIRYLVDDDANERLTSEMKKWNDELLKSGKRPFIIPIGGSTGLGALGYVKAIHEISNQFKQESVQIILGVGSCGTIAGVILGVKMFMPRARVIGISVSRSCDAIKHQTKKIILDSAALINYSVNLYEVTIECYEDYFVEYGLITKEGQQAIRDCANLEGILLDPIYTGKVMAALTDLTNKGIVDKNIPVIFIHTGGLPIIFSFENELGKTTNIKKIYKPM